MNLVEFNAYQQFTQTTAIYPGGGLCSPDAVIYTALGLAGEAGELANKAKKIMRDGDDFRLRNDMRDELGDVLWYLARLSDELGIDLARVARNNVDKLRDRVERGVISGSGDNR